MIQADPAVAGHPVDLEDVQVAAVPVTLDAVMLVVVIVHHVVGIVQLAVLMIVSENAEVNVQIPALEVALVVMVVKARVAITPVLIHAEMVVLQYVWHPIVVVAGDSD